MFSFTRSCSFLENGMGIMPYFCAISVIISSICFNIFLSWSYYLPIRSVTLYFILNSSLKTWANLALSKSDRENPIFSPSSDLIFSSYSMASFLFSNSMFHTSYGTFFLMLSMSTSIITMYLMITSIMVALSTSFAFFYKDNVSPKISWCKMPLYSESSFIGLCGLFWVFFFFSNSTMSDFFFFIIFIFLCTCILKAFFSFSISSSSKKLLLLEH